MEHDREIATRGALNRLPRFACIAALAFAPLFGCGGEELQPAPECESDDDCDSGSECIDDACDALDRTCSHTPVADGSACDFGRFSGVCASGACEDAMLCAAVECDDGNDCTDDACNPQDGACSSTPLHDGAICETGACRSGECQPITSLFPCSEQGIRDAIATGGGPHAFACDGPTTIETTEEIVIDDHVILDGLGELTVDGRNDHRVFSVALGMVVDLRRLEVTNGAVRFDSGGGIRSRGAYLTLTSSTVSHCSATDGGGIGSSGLLTLIDSRVFGNTTIHDGGGIDNGGTVRLIGSTVFDNTASNGGGIDNGGSLTLAESTVSGNSARGVGGGIHNGGSLTLTNSTLSGNVTGFDGGGIANGGTLALTNCTVSGNVAGRKGGGINNGGTLIVTLSTLAGNTASHGGAIVLGGSERITQSIVSGDCSGTVSELGWLNIESPGSTCFFGLWSGVPEDELKLGPLRDNGGFTETHALLPGSVAVGAIRDAACEADTDQRGVERPQGDGCDVGAFELEP